MCTATGAASTTSTSCGMPWISRTAPRPRTRPMIEAPHFVEAARARGFDWYAGVPCSYLTPFINYVLQDPALHYLSMANEGDAVALIAGVALAGGAGAAPRLGGTLMEESGVGQGSGHPSL